MSANRPHVAYVSYNGLVEPLGSSQVLPYLKALSSKFRFTVISFEKSSGPVARDPAEIEDELTSSGNRWIRCAYHSGAGLMSKVYDLASGVRALRRLVRMDRYDLIHARGYVPAAIAVLSSGGRRVPYLFDIRGLQAEESVDAGTWVEGGLNFRVTKRAERTLLSRASGVVTLTEAIKPFLSKQPGLAGRVNVPWEVIPCCVDLQLFRPNPAARATTRKELGVSDTDFVFVYAGSVGTWYSVETAIRMVAETPGGFFLCLTHAPTQALETLCLTAGLPPSRYRIQSAARAEMPRFLAASDIAVSPVRASLSKKASSPTKVAEALACGVGVAALSGVGDLDALAEAYPDAISLIEPGKDWRAFARSGSIAARRVAERHFSLELAVRRYDSIYSCLIR